jgi:hypothetical protein
MGKPIEGSAPHGLNLSFRFCLDCLRVQCGHWSRTSQGLEPASTFSSSSLLVLRIEVLVMSMSSRRGLEQRLCTLVGEVRRDARCCVDTDPFDGDDPGSTRPNPEVKRASNCIGLLATRTQQWLIIREEQLEATQTWPVLRKVKARGQLVEGRLFPWPISEKSRRRRKFQRTCLLCPTPRRRWGRLLN